MVCWLAGESVPPRDPVQRSRYACWHDCLLVALEAAYDGGGPFATRTPRDRNEWFELGCRYEWVLLDDYHDSPQGIAGWAAGPYRIFGGPYDGQMATFHADEVPDFQIWGTNHHSDNNFKGWTLSAIGPPALDAETGERTGPRWELKLVPTYGRIWQSFGEVDRAAAVFLGISLGILNEQVVVD